MTITFLGTGSAIPIPRTKPNGSVHDCPQCRSGDTRDRRWPSSLLIDRTILIDAPPEIRELLHSVKIDPHKIEIAILTHRHTDAAGGLSSLPKGVRQVFPRRPGMFRVGLNRIEAVKVPHDNRTWGYLINDSLAYFSDYADIKPALLALRRASVAVLDGSGWDSAFPTHQPMVPVIKKLKRFERLKSIFFTHVGHTRLTHRELERKTKELGDKRFSIACHGLALTI